MAHPEDDPSQPPHDIHQLHTPLEEGAGPVIVPDRPQAGLILNLLQLDAPPRFLSEQHQQVVQVYPQPSQVKPRRHRKLLQSLGK